MQVNPSSPAILIASSTRFQGGGTTGDGGFNAPHSCFSARKEAQVPQLKVTAGACPIPPRILKMLQDEFPQLLRPSMAAPQPTHGLVQSVGRYLPKLASWSRPSAASPWRSSPPSRRQVLYHVAHRRGPPRCTWCPKRMDPVAAAVTTAASTPSRSRTGTPCPT
jgi:hypothetical protein